jgi:hypothetical protein
MSGLIVTAEPAISASGALEPPAAESIATPPVIPLPDDHSHCGVAPDPTGFRYSSAYPLETDAIDW